MAELSYPEMRRDFYQKYQQKIVPLIKAYDKERKFKLALAILISSFFSIIGIAIIIAYILSETKDSDTFEVCAQYSLMMFALAIISWCTIKKNFENKIKKKIMPTVCSCFETLEWSVGMCMYSELFKESAVIPDFTEEVYDDIFKGTHRGVNMEILESKFYIGSGKNRRKVFKGVIVKLDMNKNFTSHTVIAPDTLLHLSPKTHLKHTTLEDVQFEKKFDVFTNDEVDARYLITPTFMERLKAMKTAFKADKIRCAFFGDILLVALSTKKDLFSLCSLVKPIDDARQYFQMYEEIVSIIKLIDHFKLNQKIGL